MKSKSILAGCIAALTLAGAAQAATYHVYLTGSTAFRSATNTSLQALYGAPVAQSNAALGSADAALFIKANYPLGGDTTYVKTTFLGAAGGIQSVSAGSEPVVANRIKVPFYLDTAVGTLGRPDTLTAANREDKVPDIALGDTYQGTTPFNGTQNRNIGTLASPVIVSTTYEDLTPQDFLVGVVTFKYVGSNGFPAGYSMDANKAQALYPTGRYPLSLITGLSADKTKIVFSTGRNFDSGTRLATFAENGVGAASVVKQWKPTIAAGVVTDQVLYPVELINGLSTQFAGNSGEASGSTLRGNLTATIPAAIYNTPAKGGKATATGAYYVSYLGVSDANSVAASTTSLRWNGVDFSELAVQQGQYTFWSYEHVLYRADSVGTTAETVATDLIAQLTAPAAALSPNVRLTDMVVSRGTDGGVVGPDFTF